MRELRLVLSLLGAAALCADLNRVAAQELEIRLNRPAKADQVYRVVIHVSEQHKNTTKAEEKVIDEAADERRIDFIANARIVAVDDKGKPTQIEYTMEKMNLEHGEDHLELLVKDQLLTAKLEGGRTTFALREGDFFPEARECLPLVLDLGEDFLDDAVFGTEQNRAVNSSWPVKAPAATRVLERINILAKPEWIKGSLKFAALKHTGTADTLELTGDLTVTPFKPGDLSPDYTLTAASMKASFALSLPKDPAKMRLEESATRTASATLKGQVKDQEIVVEMTSKYVRSVKYQDPPK